MFVKRLSCQREGDLGEDSSRLYRHSKVFAMPLVESAVKNVLCIFDASITT